MIGESNMEARKVQKNQRSLSFWWLQNRESKYLFCLGYWQGKGDFYYIKLSLILNDMMLLEIQKKKKMEWFHWVFLVAFEPNLEEWTGFFHVGKAREIHGEEFKEVVLTLDHI